MAVKKGVLDNFLKPSSHYSDNQKNLRSIFIDKDIDGLSTEIKSSPIFEKPDIKQEPDDDYMPLKTGNNPATFIDKDIDGDGDGVDLNLPTLLSAELKISSGLKNLDVKQEPDDYYMPQQTDNKLTTNRQQSGNKPTTNRQQTGNEVETKKRNWQQSGNTTGNTTGNKVATNRQQSGNKVATKSTFSELVGLQRDIVIFMCHECKNSRSKTTESLTLEYIAMSLKRNAGAIKTTIQRLEKKGFLLRVVFKNGRGGWSQYEVPDNVYHDALRSETDNKVTTNRQQTDNKVAAQPATELATTPSSSSSILKTTTTQISDEWNFNIIPYQTFGFTFSHVKQLASLGTISSADVEQSLVEFSYDLAKDALPQIKTSKINFLMGLLRGGHLYTSETFRNEQEAIISEMARRAESKRKKLLEEKFLAWEAALSTEERTVIDSSIPTSLKVLYRVHGISNPEIKKWLLNFYLKKCAD